MFQNVLWKHGANIKGCRSIWGYMQKLHVPSFGWMIIREVILEEMVYIGLLLNDEDTSLDYKVG